MKRRGPEECLDLLLAARGGDPLDDIPRRPGASPIDPAVQLFLVVHGVRPGECEAESTPDSIRVKYNGFTRAQVWWSRRHGNRFGLVCRRMGLRPRASKERHGFAGYWFFLADRESSSSWIDTNIKLSLVQFWAANEPGFTFTPDQAMPTSPVGALPPVLPAPGAGSGDEEVVPVFSPYEHLSDSCESSFSREDGALPAQESASACEPDSDEAILDLLVNHMTENSRTIPPLASDVMREACRTLSESEFERWFVSNENHLDSQQYIQLIQQALEARDPRVSIDFYFPSDIDFESMRPTGSAIYHGTYETGFNVLSSDELFRSLLAVPKPEGDPRIFDKLVESTTSAMFLHIFFKQRISSGRLDRTNFCFQSLLRLPDGRRVVMRCMSTVIKSCAGTGEGSPEAAQTVLRIQDVSDLYADLLARPILP